MNHKMSKVDKTLLVRNTFEFLSNHNLLLTINVCAYNTPNVTVTMTRNSAHVKVYMTVQEYVEMLNDIIAFRVMLFDMYGKICQEEKSHDKLEK